MPAGWNAPPSRSGSDLSAPALLVPASAALIDALFLIAIVHLPSWKWSFADRPGLHGDIMVPQSLHISFHRGPPPSSITMSSLRHHGALPLLFLLISSARHPDGEYNLLSIV
jgi:hypothetical protein